MLSELWKKYDLKPSKKYGQNYLVNFGVVKKIVEEADLKKEDIVVEVGPGFGVLTFELAKKVKKIFAFEIEQKLKDYWQEKQIEFPNIEIIWGNVLNHYNELIKNLDNFKIVANLPYQITSEILRLFLENEKKPESIIVMVQKEVAERILERDKKSSLLSLSVKYYGDVRLISKVARGSFFPAPKVDSAVIEIIIKKDLKKNSVEDEKNFFRVVKAGFKNKRKQVSKNLSEELQIDRKLINKILQEIGLREDVRAEKIGLSEWIIIVSKINKL
ncbi:MAG: 16S rRNA (adenine(1518)-N(6)/adenine(1519)-N(6))-dimethyltransferase RsmA [Patescibacteria group bacterium]